jgi:short subunit dehydrogenase-like uncharacterized protein
MQWMIYGATGYTGQLVVEEAIRRGHKPIIAGRNPDKLEALAARYNLEYMAFQLDDVSVIAEAIADMDIVYHAAGPFIHTSEPMRRACLATRTTYLDITGEVEIFERTFSLDDAARKNGIALISGVGFDVVPTDCLAAYVAQQVTGATLLETGIVGFYGASAGTTNSALEMLPGRWYGRRDGKLIDVPFADQSTTLVLPDGRRRHAISVPWGDISVAYRSTGIPNILSYLEMHPVTAAAARIGFPIGRVLLKSGMIRGALTNLVNRFVDGPSEQSRTTGKTMIWARATGPGGLQAEAWLETVEPYQFTAKAAVLAVERAAELELVGALTPSQAFGADFVLEIAGTKRIDTRR